MRSRCCETGSASGFTLLELVAVVGLLAMTAGLVAASLGGSSVAARQRRALEGLTTELLITRIEAMRTGSERELRTTVGDEALRTSVSGRERSWPVKELVGVASRQEFTARFDPSGRTGERAWNFTRQAEAANTLFVIEFDPVSGAPHLRRASERSPFTEDRP